MRRRQQRAHDFRAPRTVVAFGICQDLCTDALRLLLEARAQRPTSAVREDGGHYAHSVPASILLVTTAFDQWLNHIAFSLSVRFPRFRDIAVNLDPPAKHAAFIQEITGEHRAESHALRMAFQVRDEITHWLPRIDGAGSYWPEWLAELQDQGLVLRAPVQAPNLDGVDLTGKLHSYALALWVWRTLEAEANTLVQSFPPEMEVERNVASTGSEGFARHTIVPE